MHLKSQQPASLYLSGTCLFPVWESLETNEAESRLCSKIGQSVGNKMTRRR